MDSKGWGLSELPALSAVEQPLAGQGLQTRFQGSVCPKALPAQRHHGPVSKPQARPCSTGWGKSPYLGRHCGWAQGARPRLAPSVTAGSSWQPQHPLSRIWRCSSSSELLKAGLSSELAEGSPERDQYWAETSSRRQKRR